MLAILNSLNAHNLPIFQPILVIFVSKVMVYRALSDETYLSLGLLSPFNSLFCMLFCHQLIFLKTNLLKKSISFDLDQVQHFVITDCKGYDRQS